MTPTLPANQDSQERLTLLQTLLHWEGRLVNGRIRHLFGLSVPRASGWIRELREAYPNWTEWESRTRSYVATPAAYAALVGDPAASLDRYIGLVGLIPHDHQPIGRGHAIHAAFAALGTPSPAVFGTLNRAIHTGTPVEITYSSMQHPVPHQRTIHPHSLVRTDQRWHARAYCEANAEFRDFNLGRISRVQILKEKSPIDSGDDVAWNTLVPIRLVAHPSLTLEQSRMIRREYFAGTAARVEMCRGALVHYVLKTIQAAVDHERQAPPDYLLALENFEEVRPWLFMN